MSPEEWTYLVVLLISIPIGFLFKKAGELGSLPSGNWGRGGEPGRSSLEGSRLMLSLLFAGPGLKRWGAAAVGLGLTLFTCGPHTLHSLITILGTWALIQAQPW